MRTLFGHSLSVFLLTAFAAIARSQGSGADEAVSTPMSLLHNELLGGQRAGESIKCGLPATSFALHNRQLLNHVQRRALESILIREARQKSIVRGSFRIHYDTVGFHAPAMLDASYQRIPGTANLFADSVASIVNQVATYEIGTLGFPSPPNDFGAGGGDEYDIYIRELGNLYGSTTPETQIDTKPDGGLFTSYITIDNDFIFVRPDSNKGLPGMRVTLAHEFHHAIQMGCYGYWTSEIYFYEMTSVWMEDEVYTNVNDYYEYLYSSQGHFRLPDVPFTSNAAIIYSRGIWCIYLAKRFGRDAIRRVWEHIQTVRPLHALDNGLSEAGSSFRNAFAEWTLWNFRTGDLSDSIRYYPEGRYYPRILQVLIEFGGSSRTIPGTLGPFASRYYEVAGAVPVSLILSNINFQAAVPNPGSTFPYTLLLNIAQIDPSYTLTPGGFYVKLDVADPGNWHFNRRSSGREGDPFPSPFIANGFRVLNFPIAGLDRVPGTLMVFSSSMDLVCTASLISDMLDPPGRQVFQWNGKDNNGEPLRSGIYIFVLEFPGRLITGKIAVIRE